MREHIAKTIDELQLTVDRGIQTIQLLKDFDAATPDLALPPRVNPSAPAPEESVKSAKGVKGANGNGKNRATPPE